MFLPHLEKSIISHIVNVLMCKWSFQYFLASKKPTKTCVKTTWGSVRFRKPSCSPGVSLASHSHPRSRPGRDRAAAARSSRGLLQPWSCDRGASTPGCPCSQGKHPSPTASDREGRKHTIPSVYTMEVTHNFGRATDLKCVLFQNHLRSVLHVSVYSKDHRRMQSVSTHLSRWEVKLMSCCI